MTNETPEEPIEIDILEDYSASLTPEGLAVYQMVSEEWEAQKPKEA